MEMSIPYCVHAEISQKSDLWGIACGNRKDIKRIMPTKRCRNHRSARNAQSYSHVDEHTAERESIIVYGVLERKEHDDNIRAVCSPKVQVWEQALLESGLLCEYQAVQRYIRNQEQEDMITDQISMVEYYDPFKIWLERNKKKTEKKK